MSVDQKDHRTAIDMACCEFVFLQPTFHANEAGVLDPDPVWPEVSTDWTQHGRLVDMLHGELVMRGRSLRTQINSSKNGQDNEVALIAPVSPPNAGETLRAFGRADTIPKAFALAVVELSLEFERLDPKTGEKKS